MRDLTEEEKAINFINRNMDIQNIIIYLKDLELRKKIFEEIMFEHLDDTNFLLSLNKIIKDIDKAKYHLQKYI